MTVSFCKAQQLNFGDRWKVVGSSLLAQQAVNKYARRLRSEPWACEASLEFSKQARSLRSKSEQPPSLAQPSPGLRIKLPRDLMAALLFLLSWFVVCQEAGVNHLPKQFQMEIQIKLQIKPLSTKTKALPNYQRSHKALSALLVCQFSIAGRRALRRWKSGGDGI